MLDNHPKYTSKPGVNVKYGLDSLTIDLIPWSISYRKYLVVPVRER